MIVYRRTPIVGDSTYGNGDWNNKLLKQYGIQRPLLHAYCTSFTHPFTNELIELKAPLPDDIYRVLSHLSPVPSLALPVSASDSNDALLIDPLTRFLRCSLDVKEKFSNDNVGVSGGSGMKGFVPYDRLTYDDEHDTSFDLPETMPE